MATKYTVALSSSRAAAASVEGRFSVEKRPSTFASAYALTAQGYGLGKTLSAFVSLCLAGQSPAHKFS